MCRTCLSRAVCNHCLCQNDLLNSFPVQIQHTHTHTQRLLPVAKQWKIGFTSDTLSHGKINMRGSGVLWERCLSVCRVDEPLCWLNALLHLARICHGDSVADWVVSFEGVGADRAVCLIVPLSLVHLRRIHWCPLTQSCSGLLRVVIGSSFACLCVCLL